MINLYVECCKLIQIGEGAKIRNRYNQIAHLTQDTNRKATNSQLDTTNESQERSTFPAGDPKAHINRRAQRHNKHKTENHKRATKEVPTYYHGTGETQLRKQMDTVYRLTPGACLH